LQSALKWINIGYNFREDMSELLYEKFDDEVSIYKFLNKISKDKLVRVVSIVRLSGSEEENFELYYKFLEEGLK
jgi:hypothetical protein